MEARRHREAFFGERDGGLEQVLPRQLAVPGVRQREEPDLTRHAGRDAAHGHRVAVARLAVGAEEMIGPHRGGRGHPAVIAVDPLAGGRPVHQVAAAAQPRGLRLDQPQHERGGDRRVHRRAAAAENGEAGLGGMRVGGCDHEGLRVRGLLRGEAGIDLRLLPVLCRGRRTAQKNQREKAGDAALDRPQYYGMHGEPAGDTGACAPINGSAYTLLFKEA